MTNEEARGLLADIKGSIIIRAYSPYVEALELAIKALERPQGEWIDNSEEDSYYANCSHCGYQIDTHYERGYLNYCPNCGADMRGDGK